MVKIWSGIDFTDLEREIQKSWSMTDMIPAVLPVRPAEIKNQTHFNLETCGYNRYQNEIEIFEIECLSFFSIFLVWKKTLIDITMILVQAGTMDILNKKIWAKSVQYF